MFVLHGMMTNLDFQRTLWYSLPVATKVVDKIKQQRNKDVIQNELRTKATEFRRNLIEKVSF